MTQNDSLLLERLVRHEVEFVVIGGVCGVLHGVSLLTFDLDVCIRLGEANLRRIEEAVKDLHPTHRLTANKLRFELNDHLCRELKNVYLRTDMGVLDCLGEVAGIGDYDAAVTSSIVRPFSFGNIRMLNIDALIAAKEAVGRDRDIAAVKQLRAIKERSEKF